MQLGQTPLKPFPQNGPIAVAVSGGGDSMALLGLCLEQAGEREVHALIVDHGLREGSDQEAKLTARRCSTMDAKAQILTWQPPAQSSAVQERARIARYGLMGQACREIGARALFVGHTRDDQVETIYIRQECGSGWRGLAGMAASQYAPIWPQLYDVTLLRPLLGVSRADLRGYNARHGIEWLEDPSNENIAFHRVRARAALTEDEALRARLLSLAGANSTRRQAERVAAFTMIGQVEALAAGGFSLPVDCLDGPGGHLLLARLILCASGRAQQTDMAAIERLLGKLQQTEFKQATLGGALIKREDDTARLQISRETGRWLVANEHMVAAKDAPVIFDGRYEIVVQDEDLSIGPLWPARAQLGDAQAKALKSLPAQLRRGLFGVFKARVLIDVPELTDYLPEIDKPRHEICSFRHLTEARLRNGLSGDWTTS